MSRADPDERVLPPGFWRQRSPRRRPLGVVAWVVAALVPVVALGLLARWARGEADARTSVPLTAGAPVAVSTSTPVLSLRRVPSTVADPVADARLATALQPIVAAMPASACLVVTRDGTAVVDVRGDSALVPASNAKLLVAGAALAVLGPDARYRTSLLAGTPPAGGVVTGDVYLRGAGDPLLATDGYATYLPRIGKNAIEPHTSLEVLADAIVTAGVTRVSGRIVGDETRYDTQRYLPTWPPDRRTDPQIGPQSALSVNDGYSPYDPLTPSSAPATSAALILTELLEARGVAVDGAPGEGATPADAVEVAGIDSAPMRDVVGEMLRESDNGTAELVLKEIGLRAGGSGSTAAGASAALTALAAEGVAVGGAVLADGSGLSADDRSSCRTFAGVLDDAELGPGLEAAMAVAGQTGTLAEEGRFATNPARGVLRGKSGRLEGASALSGVVPAGEGHRLSFSLLWNGEGARSAAEPRWEDLAAALVAYPQRPPLEAFAPAATPAGTAAPVPPAAPTGS